MLSTGAITNTNIGTYIHLKFSLGNDHFEKLMTLYAAMRIDLIKPIVSVDSFPDMNPKYLRDTQQVHKNDGLFTGGKNH